MDYQHVETVIFPSALYVQKMIESRSPQVKIGIQNVSSFKSGAYTGEISADQVKSIGAELALVGHSERRSLFGEDAPMIRQKIQQIQSQGLTALWCCGEPLSVRMAGDHLTFVTQQLEDELSAVQWDRLIIAYEPIWAIGTGQHATPAQAQEMHAHIRSWVKQKTKASTSDSLKILYGGSCNPSNASELFKQNDIDGALVGGASLNATTFFEIIRSAAIYGID